MSMIGYLPVILRETLGRRRMVRRPETGPVMEERERVEAYVDAGHVENTTLASLLFHDAHCSVTIAGARRVIDLGCGPATQLVRLAILNPETEFLGVDLSEPMLEKACGEAARAGADNVKFHKADMTHLPFLGDRSVDAVISTMTLHHLPTQGHLRRFFREVHRVLCPGGAVYLADFTRLKSEAAVRFFSDMDSGTLAPAVLEDYRQSMRAAFALADLREGLALLPELSALHSTFMVPLLSILHTPRRRLAAETHARLRAMREALTPTTRRKLDDMRLFFRLGGLPGDPFDPLGTLDTSTCTPVAGSARGEWTALTN